MATSITSDRDYLELVESDEITINANSSPPPADALAPQSGNLFGRDPTNFGNARTITHNIGSIPIVRAWIDSDKNGRLYNTARYTSGNNSGDINVVFRPYILTVNTATTTRLLTISPVSETNLPVIYRIYRFGTKSLTSDEPIDKIFDKGNRQLSLGAASNSISPVATTHTVFHGRGERILYKLQFSIDQNAWYDEGSPLFGPPDPNSDGRFYYYDVAYASADSMNFFVTYVHNYPSTRTIHTRWIWEFI